MCRTSFHKVIQTLKLQAWDFQPYTVGCPPSQVVSSFMVNRASPTKYTLIVVILLVPLAEKGTIPYMCAAGNFTAWFLHAKTGFLGSGHQILLFVAVVLEF